MKAIILAAGIGRRLNNINLPKCLLKVGDETLIERHIRILKCCGISDITTVIGSEGDCWSKNNVENISKYESNVVINKFNLTYNRLYSFYCGISSLDESSLIVIDGDLFFDEKLISEIINHRKQNLLLARYHESRFNNKLGSKIILSRDDKIKAIGYNLTSNLIYSGIFKTKKNIFDFLLHIANKKDSWGENMSYLFNSLMEKLTLYTYLINTKSEILDLPSKSDDCKPLINYFEIKDSIITKSSSSNKERLINEMNYLINIPQNLKPYFPEVLFYKINENKASYSMPYYKYPLFSDLLIKQELSESQIIKIFQSILDFCFNKLYKSDCNQTPEYFIRQNYINKFQFRLIKAMGKSKLFDSILNEKHLIINNKKMINAPIILEMIMNNNNLLSKLEPPFVSLYHGDFRLGNILINKAANSFILIDPRGSTPSGMYRSDPIEDIAKLFATCKVKYDLIQMGEINCDIINKKIFEIIISPKKDFRNIANNFSSIPNLLLPIIQSYINKEEDIYWEMRLEFIQALLLLGLAPYKLISEENENECIILYSEGVAILNKFISNNLKGDCNNYNLININTQLDIERAESIIFKN